mgnify:CR=1 FL=1
MEKAKYPKCTTLSLKIILLTAERKISKPTTPAKMAMTRPAIGSAL